MQYRTLQLSNFVSFGMFTMSLGNNHSKDVLIRVIFKSFTFSLPKKYLSSLIFDADDTKSNNKWRFKECFLIASSALINGESSIGIVMK